MNNLGWISLDRKIADNWVWQEKPFSTGQAWVDMLLTANHKNNEVLFEGKVITIQRGSFLTSILKLSSKYGWERKKTTRFLNLLENQKMITTKRTTHGTTITIVNYDFYQNVEQPMGQHMGQHMGQRVDSTWDTNNNDNNVTSKKQCASDNAPRTSKAEINDFFENVWKLYPSKKGKGQISDTKKKTLYDIGYDEISRAIDRYKAGLANDEWRKPQNGSTFFNSGYIDYLDANYSEREQKEPEKGEKTQYLSYEEMERQLREEGIV